MSTNSGLFTIGHSLHQVETFIALLQQHDIDYVYDVRSVPSSKYAPQFNREAIKRELGSAGIGYAFSGVGFGARQADESLYTEEGYLDFNKTACSPAFARAMEGVIKGLEQGNRIALMCTEKDPIDCHRAIMVSRAFSLKGIEVSHILADGRLQSQAELDRRLLDLYFPTRDQISFLEPYVPEEVRLISAYEKRNADIGYHLQQDESATM